MNICTKCSKKIYSIKICNNCNKQFCSEACLRHHTYTFHYNEQSSKQLNDKKIIKNAKNYINKNNNYNNNYIEISHSFSSPYITKGSMILGNIIYDKTYSLKNFRPVIEDGKEVIIGSGAYGKVFLAINKTDKKYYAIKHMKKKDLFKNLKTLRGIYKEIDIQSRINHPNIVKLLYVKENQDAFDLVMEYAKYGNLYHYIKRNSYLSEEKSFKYFIQVVNAVYFLHKNDLIHRDIKPENILIFEDGVIKLCDFGWCTKLNGGQRITFCGTVEYMSPEMVNKEEYSKEIDIWSLGILLYEMIHGHSPFRPDKPKFNMNDVIGNIKIKNLKFNNDISDECKELIIHLLDRDITKRYKIDDIYNSKFVKFYEKQNKYFMNKNINININHEKENNNKNIENMKKIYKEKKNLINEVQNDGNIIIENELQKMKCKVKNNTARNFYPHQFEKDKEKENIDDVKNKYGSHCKVKKTENKFDKNIVGITPRYISHDNINNFFKKPNVKEKEKSLKSKVNSVTDLLYGNNNEIKCQNNPLRKITSSENILRNKPNQSLTNRNKKSYQTVKNRQISMDNIKNQNINNIQDISDNEAKLFDNRYNYTNRTRLNSCEKNHPNKIVKKSKEYFSIYNIEENKVPLITEIYEENIDINNNIKNKRPNSKVKAKILQNKPNNAYEKKINILNYIHNTGKKNTKVKNYYRSNNKIENKTNNKSDINNNYNSSSSQPINEINNNNIYNNNILKYSTFINYNKNMSNNQKKKEDSNKNNIIIRNFGNYKPSSNNGIILLTYKDNNNNKNNWPSFNNKNKDNNCSDNETIKDLDETPKKDIDNLKIMPYELLNNFNKELNGYLKKE